jgi:branched-chain amino acid aminotransferase
MCSLFQIIGHFKDHYSKNSSYDVMILKNPYYFYKKQNPMDENRILELYEVFRVERGIALFLEDHIERLFYGADKAGIKLNFNFKTIENYLKNILIRGQIKTGNVKFSVFFNSTTGRMTSYEAFSIPYSYPTQELYNKGISCGLFFSERQHPETKIANTPIRKFANQLIKEKDFFEVLLVNHHEEIPEGSRSNVFFIRNNKLITAPHPMVLPGIARKKTLDIAQTLNIPVAFSALPHKNLKDIEAAFITGTSPRILAIKSIDSLNLKAAHPIIQQLTRGFSELVESYIKK